MGYCLSDEFDRHYDARRIPNERMSFSAPTGSKPCINGRMDEGRGHTLRLTIKQHELNWVFDFRRHICKRTEKLVSYGVQWSAHVVPMMFRLGYPAID